MSGPPPGSATVRVTVTVARDDTNRVWSAHELASSADEALAMSWPSGGVEQVAFALLTEAVRREAILDMLLKMTDDPGYVERLRGMPPDERRSEVERLAALLCEHIGKVSAMLAPGAIAEAMDAVGAGVP